MDCKDQSDVMGDFLKSYEEAAPALSYIVKPVDFDAFFMAYADMGLHYLVLNQPQYY
ncbi:MAG: hypothetical protein K8T10_15030 [Candidatus Eremiobacteraeota bacterium]|nr:hypothetical protein [Candidatus Eremiobacteraeota bacterium]